MTRITPPTWRRTGIHCERPAAANVAVTPSSVKTAPEAGDVGERVAQGDPAGDAGRSAVGGDRGACDGDGGQLAEVGGHERQDARAEEADQPAASATRIVRLSALIDRRLTLVERLGEEAPDRRGRRGQLQPPAARLEDRDRGEPCPLQLRVRRDVPFADGGAALAACRAVLEEALEHRPGLVAEVAALAGEQDDLGTGGGHGACILGAIDAGPGSCRRRRDRGRGWSHRIGPSGLDVVRLDTDDASLRRDRPARSPRGIRALAVSEEILEPRRGVRIAHPGRKLVAFVFAVILGVAAVVSGLVAFHESLAGRILPGVSAAGVDLAGLTTDEARAALTARYGALVRWRRWSFAPGSASTTIPFASVGRGADVDAMLAQAAQIGRGGTWLDETIAAIRLRLEPATVPLVLTYDHDRAAAAVVGLRRSNDARARRRPGRPDRERLRDAARRVDGEGIDAAAAISAVDAAMRDPATAAGAAVTAPTTSVAPALTTDRGRPRPDAGAADGRGPEDGGRIEDLDDPWRPDPDVDHLRLDGRDLRPDREPRPDPEGLRHDRNACCAGR